MEQTECSETSAYKIQTPEKYPEESIQQKPWLRRFLHLPDAYTQTLSSGHSLE